MDNKIALFILYNHHYTKNIDRLNELYKDKFSYIYHLIPFYKGDRNDVIAVYDSSIQFNSFIAQAYQKVKKEGYTHYYVIADDMIINPVVTELNIFDVTGIPEDSAYINDVRDNRTDPYEVPLFEKIMGWGIEVMNILPSKKNAIERMEKKRLWILPSKIYALKWLVHHALKCDWRKVYHALYYIWRKDKDYIYPALWAYSDTILVPSMYMEDFARYCGALAGLNIFVEQAIPIAMYLSCENIVLGNTLKLKGITQLYTLGEEGKAKFEQRYNFSLQKLIDEYPSDVFYVHPIKLSKWK